MIASSSKPTKQRQKDWRCVPPFAWENFEAFFITHKWKILRDTAVQEEIRGLHVQMALCYDLDTLLIVVMKVQHTARNSRLGELSSLPVDRLDGGVLTCTWRHQTCENRQIYINLAACVTRRETALHCSWHVTVNGSACKLTHFAVKESTVCTENIKSTEMNWERIQREQKLRKSLQVYCNLFIIWNGNRSISQSIKIIFNMRLKLVEA